VVKTHPGSGRGRKKGRAGKGEGAKRAFGRGQGGFKDVLVTSFWLGLGEPQRRPLATGDARERGKKTRNSGKHRVL